jgi:catechol 2,3-dioxygenase
MDAPNPSAQPTFASRTPIHVGSVALKVRDLDRVASFYRDVIGLTPIEAGAAHVRLGAGGVGFLELTQQEGIALDDGRSAGLYHTAFLMPTRADLGRWVVRIANEQTPVTGASDHGVSEAFYLDDPEGNGVEVYADRPPDTWDWRDGMVNMPTEALDVGKLVAVLGAKPEPYRQAPDGMRIGHVHLRVGDLAPAERFYREGVGLDLTRKRHGAAFMSSGRYHHHVAGNIWQSNGAGPRDPGRAGLDWFALELADATMLDTIAARLRNQGAAVTPLANGIEASDPWGTRLRLMSAPH